MIMKGVLKEKDTAYFVVMTWYLSGDTDVSRGNWSGKQVTLVEEYNDQFSSKQNPGMLHLHWST